MSLTLDEFERGVLYNSYHEQEIKEISLYFLKEHGKIKNSLHVDLSTVLHANLIDIVVDYIVKKHNPYKILKIVCSCRGYSLNDYTVEELKEFISEGWDINFLGKYNHWDHLITPLLYACMTGRYSFIEFYLKHGADPNIADSRGYSTLSLILHKYFNHIPDQSEIAKKYINLLRKYDVSFKLTPFILKCLTFEYLDSCGVIEDFNVQIGEPMNIITAYGPAIRTTIKEIK